MKVMVEEILTLIGDMESFPIENDNLSSLVSETDEGELNEYDLTLVAAASKPPSYHDFLCRYCKA